MLPTDYSLMSDMGILALVCWREARGEGLLGKRAVACVVRNRIAANSFFGHDWHSVILKPYQFSSFNANDPNADKWPEDNDPSWEDCCDVAQMVIDGAQDVTNNALYYFSPPLTEPPREWGSVIPAANIGHLSLWKPGQAVNLDAQDA
jgi:spore germination cell wall hydrolase CwlJ-like protein